jgi:ATP synthase protein I
MSDQRPETSPPGDAAEAELLARRRTLEARLAAQRLAAKPSSDGPGKTMRGAADGMKLASEFVAGVLAGAGIGYLLDRIAGTQPFGLVFFLLLGFVAGVLNVLRSIGKAPQSGPVAAPPPASAAALVEEKHVDRPY